MAQVIPHQFTGDRRRALRLIQGGADTQAPAAQVRCYYCGEPISIEGLTEDDGHTVHLNCLHRENDRLAWQATRDAISLALRDAARGINDPEISRLRRQLCATPIRLSEAFRLITTVSARLRQQAASSQELKAQVEKNLEEALHFLNHFLRGR